jgi:hypothetical protein
MNLFRLLSGTALLGLASAGLSSCLIAPDYPIEPSIDFSDLQVTRIPAGAGGILAVDELNFTLSFRDGDGDLGLSDDDIKVAPWNSTTGGHNNRGYSYNYFIQPYIKDSTGKFVLFTTPLPPSGFGFIGEYDGRFLHLDESGAKAAPLKGDLRYKLPLSLDGSIYKAGQVFRFEISIMDRGLHESNKITTSEVTL